MRIGEDWFYSRLKNEFYSKDNAEICKLLYDDLRAAASGYARRIFKPPHWCTDDIEDAASEAVWKIVSTVLPKLLEEPIYDSCDSTTRNSYIKTSLWHSCIDSYHKMIRSRGSCIGRDEEGNKIYIFDVDIDQLAGSLFAPGYEEPLISVNEALEGLFSLTGPSPRTLLICSSAILLSMRDVLDSSGQSDSPIADIAKYISSKSNEELLEDIEDILKLINVPIELLDDLKLRLKNEGRSSNEIGAQPLSKMLHRIRKKLLEKSE